MHSEKLPINKELLGKYLSGKSCTYRELKVLKQYFTDHAYAPAIRKLMEEEWNYLLKLTIPDKQTDSRYRHFVQTRMKPQIQNQQRVIRIARHSMRHAALLAILIVSIAIFFWFDSNKKQYINTFHWEEQIAAGGQQLKVILPDGTKIYLAPESRLWYPAAADYISGRRTVRLEGEAYFEVVHDTVHPFTVQTGSLQTIDVGTAFNITAYPGDEQIKIAVSEGEVQIIKADTNGRSVSKKLIAGMGMTYIDSAQRWSMFNFDTNEIANWRKGVFEFSSAPLEQVIKSVARYYNLRFVWQDADLKTKKLTIQFNGYSETNALQLLRITAGIRLEKAGDTVRIKKQ